MAATMCSSPNCTTTLTKAEWGVSALAVFPSVTPSEWRPRCERHAHTKTLNVARLCDLFKLAVGIGPESLLTHSHSVVHLAISSHYMLQIAINDDNAGNQNHPFSTGIYSPWRLCTQFRFKRMDHMGNVVVHHGPTRIFLNTLALHLQILWAVASRCLFICLDDFKAAFGEWDVSAALRLHYIISVVVCHQDN